MRQHVAVSYDGSKVRIFHNGLQVAVSNATQVAPFTPSDGIGRWDVNARAFSGYIDDVRLYDRALSTGQIMALYTSSVRYTTGDCNDANATINGGTVWYKDTDDDGYSDGTALTQCSQATGYKLPSALISLSGDCNDNNDLQTPYTVWYEDTDGDGFTPGSAVEQCADPGATRYLSSELIGSAVTTNSLTINSGLVGHRSFDSNDGDDESGNGNN